MYQWFKNMKVGCGVLGMENRTIREGSSTEKTFIHYCRVQIYIDYILEDAFAPDPRNIRVA